MSLINESLSFLHGFLRNILILCKQLHINFKNDNTNGIISPFTEANMEPYKVEPPVKSWVESGGMHYVHVQANSVAAEDNETDISDVLDSDQQVLALSPISVLNIVFARTQWSHFFRTCKI